LFAICGTTYGAGDGSTTFNIPDCRGNTVVGYKSGDSSFGTLGGTLGEKTHQLVINEMPSHVHRENMLNGGTLIGNGVQGNPGSGNNQYDGYCSTQSTGGDGAHNNIQPSIVMNKIIKY
jgi:microcystin-dependent protein